MRRAPTDTVANDTGGRVTLRIGRDAAGTDAHEIEIDDLADPVDAARQICDLLELESDECRLEVLSEILSQRAGRGSYEHLAPETMLAVAHELLSKRSYHVAGCLFRELNRRHLGETNVEVLQMLGLLSYSVGNLSDALVYYQACDVRVPNSSAILMNLATVHAAMRQHHKASHTLERALAIAPRDPDVLLAMATLKVETKDPAAARQYLEICAQDARSSQTCLRQLGILELNAGLDLSAADHLSQALALDPGDLGALHRLQYAEMLHAQRNGTTGIGRIRFVTFASDRS